MSHSKRAQERWSKRAHASKSGRSTMYKNHLNRENSAFTVQQNSKREERRRELDARIKAGNTNLEELMRLMQ